MMVDKLVVEVVQVVLLKELLHYLQEQVYKSQLAAVVVALQVMVVEFLEVREDLMEVVLVVHQGDLHPQVVAVEVEDGLEFILVHSIILLLVVAQVVVVRQKVLLMMLMLLVVEYKTMERMEQI